MVRARGDVDVHANRPVIERGDRLLVDPAGCDRRKRGHRDRDLLTKPRLGGEPLRCSQLRVGENPRVRVVLEQPVVHARKPGEHDVGRGQVPKVLERESGAIDVNRTGNAGCGAGTGQFESVFTQAASIDLE